MFNDSVEGLCERINDNFASNAELDGYIIQLGDGPAADFVDAAWHVSMILAAVVFGIVACYELYAQSVRTEGHGGPMGSAEIVFKVMFKVAVCYIVLQVSYDLLVGLYGTSNDLTVAFAKSGEGFFKSYDGHILDGKKIAASMPSGFWNGLWCWLCAVFVLLLSWAAKIAAWVLIMIRLLQVYLYGAISPIPLATLCSNELSQIGKGFLKSFVAVCILGALIFLVVQLFPGIIGTVLKSGGFSVADTVVGLLTISAVYSIAIIVTLVGTQQLSKRICGAA